MSSLIEDVVEEVKDFASAVWELLCDAGNAIWDGLVWLVDKICETIEGFFGYLHNLLSKLGNWVGTFFVVAFELISGGKKGKGRNGLHVSILPPEVQEQIINTKAGYVFVEGKLIENNAGQKDIQLTGLSGVNSLGSEVNRLLNENNNIIKIHKQSA